MADTVSVTYIYPPGMLDGDWDDKSGNRRVIVQLSCNSDGTGETDVIKVDLSDLKTPSGIAPTRTSVEWVKWQIAGMNVALEWDRAPHVEIVRLNSNSLESSGKFDWRSVGGKVDPGGDDRTGDILLTSTGANGNSYDITLGIRLKD